MILSSFHNELTVGLKGAKGIKLPETVKVISNLPYSLQEKSRPKDDDIEQKESKTQRFNDVVEFVAKQFWIQGNLFFSRHAIDTVDKRK